MTNHITDSVSLLPSDHELSFVPPKRIKPIGAWAGHTPFAMYIVSLLKPRVFVELGTAAGDSYCAFCQAVDALGLPTHCFAVDTWQGDPQMGFYPSTVFEELANYHDPRYGHFSSLLKMTFDEALPQFNDGEIDLLHIDGYHTYEAVRHDFETWVPKLSKRGVVLFHDTHVRHGDFGVWKFWTELKAQYPFFEFEHSSGLGILFVGGEPHIGQVLARLTDTEAKLFRAFFAARGNAVEQQRTAVSALSTIQKSYSAEHFKGREHAHQINQLTSKKTQDVALQIDKRPIGSAAQNTMSLYTVSLYIELLKKALLDLLSSDWRAQTIATTGEIMHIEDARTLGLDWPDRAVTMIGMARLNNLQMCVDSVLQNNIPGDFIETGVWRGGACIMMRGMLKVYGITDRTIWLADSFQGLPAPNADKYPADTGIDFSGYEKLKVSREAVEDNFRKFDLLDNQVQFLEGWFKATLPTAPIDQIAILRLDGDLYESTMDALTNLYPKLAIGGFAIIDDYWAVEACKKAVHDYRALYSITEAIYSIDGTGVYWQRSH